MFSLLLAANILLHESKFDMTELKFLLIGGEPKTISECPVPFISEASWKHLNKYIDIFCIL